MIFGLSHVDTGYKFDSCAFVRHVDIETLCASLSCLGSDSRALRLQKGQISSEDATTVCCCRPCLLETKPDLRISAANTLKVAGQVLPYHLSRPNGPNTKGPLFEADAENLHISLESLAFCQGCSGHARLIHAGETKRPLLAGRPSESFSDLCHSGHELFLPKKQRKLLGSFRMFRLQICTAVCSNRTAFMSFAKPLSRSFVPFFGPPLWVRNHIGHSSRISHVRLV